MTPDEIVQLIFATQLERDNDADPGDITITIQDDMDMVQVMQDGPSFFDRKAATTVEEARKGLAAWEAEHRAFSQGVFGPNIREALENYLKEVQDGTR